MRIIAIRVRPVCIAFSCLYAVVGLFAFIQYCFLEEMQQFTLPVGIIAPFVHFNINLNIPRSMTASAPVVYAIAAVFAYAVSGCISGLVGTYLFNFIAGIMGGIDARFVKTVDAQ
jgi:hypothetical protein